MNVVLEKIQKDFCFSARDMNWKEMDKIGLRRTHTAQNTQIQRATQKEYSRYSAFFPFTTPSINTSTGRNCFYLHCLYRLLFHFHSIASQSTFWLPPHTHIQQSTSNIHHLPQTDSLGRFIDRLHDGPYAQLIVAVLSEVPEQPACSLLAHV